MGQAGTALADPESWFFNPASTGIVALDRTLVLTSAYDEYPPENWRGWGGDHYTAGLDLSLTLEGPDGDSRTVLAVGYHTMRVDEKWCGRSSPAETELTWNRYFHRAILALAVEHDVTVAFGISMSYINDIWLGSKRIELDGVAIDLGGLLRVPIAVPVRELGSETRFEFSPTLGISYANLGSKWREHWTFDIELPSTIRAGLAVPTIFNSPGPFDSWEIVSITPVVEAQKLRDQSWYGKIGLEAGLGEAAYVRVGYFGE